MNELEKRQTWNDWRKYTLLPAMYENICTLFPEFGFKRMSRGWEGTTQRKIDGTDSTKKGGVGRVYCYQNNPTRLIGYKGGVEKIGLIDYYLDSNGIGDIYTAEKRIAETLGIRLPDTDFDAASYYDYKRKRNLMEDVDQYFASQLETSPEGQGVRDYLATRGYTMQQVKDMGLGFIPSQIAMREYLKGLGYSDGEVSSIALHPNIGKTNRLSIPYKIGGVLEGWDFRTIGDSDAGSKYIVSTGLERRKGFFNINSVCGGQDLILVEGELDALFATANGVQNVASYGKKHPSPEQVTDAIKRGIKSFTIIPDNDDTYNTDEVEKDIDTMRKAGAERIYVALLPSLGGKTDVDRFVLERGAGELVKVVNGAVPYYKYKLTNLIVKYQGKADETGNITPKEWDAFLDGCKSIGSEVNDPVDRDRCVGMIYNACKQCGITKEGLDAEFERIRIDREKEQQQKKLRDTIAEAARFASAGEYDKATNVMRSTLSDTTTVSEIDEIDRMLTPMTRQKLRELLAAEPDSLPTGYSVDGEEITLQSGAITIVAAKTGHGKSTMLNNIALNILKRYKEGEVYCLHYEETIQAVFPKLLSIYLNRHISVKNVRSLKSYLEDGNTQYFDGLAKSDVGDIEKGIADFFERYVESGRLVVCDVRRLNSDNLMKMIRRITTKKKPIAILVDYIQLINPSGKMKTNSRQEQMKEVCIDIKDIAVETGVPIVLAAQFNRTVLNHTQLLETNIGEAGDIERIANTVIGIWNNYIQPTGKDTELKLIEDKRMTGNIGEGSMYVKILKNRTGRVPTDGECIAYNANTGVIVQNFTPENPSPSSMEYNTKL